MSERRIWVWVMAASLVALAIGFGAAWLIQANRVADARQAVARAEDKASQAAQDLAEMNAALDAAIAERDRLELAARDASAAVPATTTPAPAKKKPSGFTGRVCGYIRSFTKRAGTTYVTMDQIEFLTGEAAAEAAAAHGDESPPPNDYYIVNDNPKLRTYPLATSVRVTMTTAPDDLRAEGYTSTIAKLMGAFGGSEPALKNAVSSPYWFTLKNGVVTALEEQYVP